LPTPDFAAAAHEYNRRGWRVIPLHRVNPAGDFCSCHKGGNCTSKGKHPIDNAWQESERLSAADIQATWDVDKAPNIGIATGKDSGFWVLDIDPKNGGMENFGELIREHGGEAMPETTVAQTGSGGYHYLFALPDFEVRNSADRVAKGVDVRGQGGQIVAAPSRTDKGAYTIIQEAPLAQAPAWLLELVRKPERTDIEIVTAEDLPKPEDLDEGTWKRYSAYAQRAITSELDRLDRLAKDGWDGEPWNHTTFEVSCALVEFANSPWCAYSLGQAQRDVLAHAPRDTDGFDDYIVRKTFDSAREKVGDKARQQPEDRRQEPQEADPLFGAPGVRDLSSGPTDGGEGQAPRLAAAELYFGGNKGTEPLYEAMARGAMDLGPIGWGVDNDFWSYADGVWVPDHYVVQWRLIDMLGNLYRRTHTTNTADIVQRHAQRLTADPLEPLMNFRNGMLDWRTGNLVDHDPSYGSTVQFGCEWLPEVECPRFSGFLNDVMHPDYVALAWEMIGYLMLSGNPMQTAFLFYGSGGNGKGTLLNVMEMLLGRENIATESLDDLNGNRFRTANLFGKIANIAGDIDATYQEHTAMFKSITGEDMITGERKNRDPFRFESWAVPVFSANKFPGSADVTDGYLRRWIVLHFHKRIPDTSKIKRSDLMAIFRAELPGIAARGVVALRELMERGRFEPTGKATEAKDEFAMAIDQVRQWHTNGGVLAGPEIETSLDDLFAHYTLWAERAGQRKLKMSEFSHRLESLNYPVSRIGGTLYFKGISIPPKAAQTTSNFF
jgi:putative DNA primase/helicase